MPVLVGIFPSIWMGIVSDREWTRLFCSKSVRMRTVGQRQKAPAADTMELLSFSRAVQFAGRHPPPGPALQGKEISCSQYLPVSLCFLPARVITPMVFLEEQLVLMFFNLCQAKSMSLVYAASTGDLSELSWSYRTQRVTSTTCVAGSRRGCLFPAADSRLCKFCSFFTVIPARWK